jgi:lipopolysaccharide biosynthesis protein
MSNFRALAIYLPQFHPIPENDKWWGKGFTEWRNVTKESPRFKGHYQPHLPADNGFYDLRVPEIMNQQMKMAREHNISGFMFYHYWFNGRRILELPLNNYLSDEKNDFPFCLCWANENWTRNWDGKYNDVLLQQDYDHDDDRVHMQYLCRNILNDDRYIRVDGKPLFVVYRTELFPDINRTAEIWRKVAKEEGFPGLYLVRAESFNGGIDPASIDFDAAFEFQPDWNYLPERVKLSKKEKLFSLDKKTVEAFAGNHIFRYRDLVNIALSKPIPVYKRFPGITPMWDNSARRKNDAFIFHESSPELFSKWLSEIIKRFKPYSKDENFIFINAWNEWGEGCHLEPCLKWDKAYLEVVQNSLK